MTAESDAKAARVRPPIQTIKPRGVWRTLDLPELWQYRDLFYFLVRREVKVLYAQSVIGLGWAVIKPIVTMLVFTVIFGKLAKINSEGVPYAIFNFAALVPWTYFSNSLTGSTNSLVAAQNMLSKVYFPRLVIPMAPALAKLVDFFIALAIMAVMMAWLGFAPTPWALALPLLVVLMVLTAAGAGMWLTALAVQYRDVKHAISFVVQLLMYVSPVVYPASMIPEKFRMLYALNPMVGVIEGFRASLLGTTPMPWHLIAVGALMAFVVFVSGVLYFSRKERVFADVV